MRWTKNENVVCEEIKDGALLIDVKSGSRWTLSATAAAAWKLCDGKRTLIEMERMLGANRQHVADFCRAFEALGLLKGHGVLAPAAVSFRTTNSSSPLSFQSAGLGTGPRRRPSPRGNSGPG